LKSHVIIKTKIRDMSDRLQKILNAMLRILTVQYQLKVSKI